MPGVLMRRPERDIDLDEVRDVNSRAINRIRSMIPGFLAVEESERNGLNANRSGHKFRPDLENSSRLRSQTDITVSGS